MVFEPPRAARSFLARRLVVADRARSPTTASSSAPPRASRARCRSGAATRPGAPPSWAPPSAPSREPARRDGRRRGRARRSRTSTASTTRAAATTSSAYVRRPGRGDRRRPERRARIVIERVPDEAGRPAHLPALALRRPRPRAAGDLRRRRAARLRELGIDGRHRWTDDGIVVRLPDVESRPRRVAAAAAGSDEVGGPARPAASATPLFAARFREMRRRGAAPAAPSAPASARRSGPSASAPPTCCAVAGRSRLVPDPARDATASACATSSTCRRCASISSAQIAAKGPGASRSTSRAPSPFAASLLFTLRRQLHLRGRCCRWPSGGRRCSRSITASLRRAARRGRAARAARPGRRGGPRRASAPAPRRPAPLKHEDQAHDLLLSLGDLSRDEIAARPATTRRPRRPASALAALDRRARSGIGAPSRSRSAARQPRRRRRGRGPAAPAPSAWRAAARPADRVPASAGRGPARRAGLRATRARTGPSRRGRQWPGASASASATGAEHVARAHRRAEARVVEGEFLARRPRPGVLRRRRCCGSARSAARLARLRAEVEPVPPEAYARVPAPTGGGLQPPPARPRRLARGARAAPGAPLSASALEIGDPARPRRATTGPAISTRSCAAGEVLWRGVEPVGDGDGRVALYLARGLSVPRPAAWPRRGALAEGIRAALARPRRALLLRPVAAETGAFGRGPARRRSWDHRVGRRGHERHARPAARPRPRVRLERPAARRATARVQPRPRGAAGAWIGSAEERGALVAAVVSPARPAPAGGASSGAPGENRGSDARRSPARCSSATGCSRVRRRRSGARRRLLRRLRRAPRAMEEAGQARRGYFVAGLGAAQFAVPGADDRLGPAASHPTIRGRSSSRPRIRRRALGRRRPPGPSSRRAVRDGGSPPPPPPEGAVRWPGGSSAATGLRAPW